MAETDPCTRIESHPADRSRDGVALCPLTDVLIRRHGWSIFDFKITANMAARTAGKVDWSKSFGTKGMCRSYLRSMKRYRRWLGIDHITYFDQLLTLGDPILFEKAGFDWIMRRGMFEIWEKPVGLPSLDDHRGAYGTYDESIFGCLATVTAVGDFHLTVEQGGNSWRISYAAMTYTPHVYLKAQAVRAAKRVYDEAYAKAYADARKRL